MWLAVILVRPEDIEGVREAEADIVHGRRRVGRAVPAGVFRLVRHDDAMVVGLPDLLDGGTGSHFESDWLEEEPALQADMDDGVVFARDTLDRRFVIGTSLSCC